MDGGGGLGGDGVAVAGGGGGIATVLGGVLRVAVGGVLVVAVAGGYGSRIATVLGGGNPPRKRVPLPFREPMQPCGYLPPSLQEPQHFLVNICRQNITKSRKMLDLEAYF